MRRRFLLGFGVVAVAMLGGEPLQATHPIFHYDLVLVPELSTLTATGGFAGVQQSYQVGGRLGLNLDRAPHPPDSVFATFGPVEATLQSDVDSNFFNGEQLDPLLTLTEWEGILIDEDLLSFTGEDGQHAPISAVADFNESHLRLRGRNLPSCCDFFEYSWDLFALNPRTEHGHAHADFDEDGDVDGDDLLTSVANFGVATGATHTVGDADADGDVDRRDTTIWRYSVAKLASGGPLFPDTTAAVPEPASGTLAVVALAAIAWRIARRRLRPSKH